MQRQELHMDEERKIQFPLLDGKNYHNWKFGMLVLLEEFDLIECLEETNEQEFTPEEDASQEVICELNEKREKRIKMERKCKSLLVQSFNDDLLELIKDKKNSCRNVDSIIHSIWQKRVDKSTYFKKEIAHYENE